jgi:hypothetical protein
VHFPWLDRLFGTRRMPEDGRWPSGYGVVQPIPREFVKQLFYLLRRSACLDRADDRPRIERADRSLTDVRDGGFRPDACGSPRTPLPISFALLRLHPTNCGLRLEYRGYPQLPPAAALEQFLWSSRALCSLPSNDLAKNMGMVIFCSVHWSLVDQFQGKERR